MRLGTGVRRDWLPTEESGWLWKIKLLAIICLGVFSIGFSPLRPKPFSDGYFHEEAKELRNWIHSGSTESAVPLVHSPGVPFYYLPSYLPLPGSASERAHWYAGVGWNCLMLWLAALLLGEAAKRASGRMAERIASAGIVISFFPLYYSAGIASETAAYLGSAAVVWAGARFIGREPMWLDAALLGGAMGFLVSMRGNYCLVFATVIVALWLLHELRKLKYAVVAVMVGCLLVAGVYSGVRKLNRRIGHRVRQDSFLTHVLIQGAFQYRSEPLDWRAWERETRGGSRDYAAYAEVRRQLEEKQRRTGAEMAVVEWDWLRRSITTEPWIWVKMAPMKAVSAFWFRISPARVEKVFGSGSRGKVVAFLISLVLNAPVLCMLGLSILGAKRMGRAGLAFTGICWAPLVAGLVFVAFTYSEPRYLVPGFTGLSVLAGCELAKLLGRWMEASAGEP